MSGDGEVGQRAAAPPLPSSIWVVAWASLAGQALLLLRQGVRYDDAVSIVVSVVGGALFVGYVSAGVVRARTVRLALAWVVLGLVLVAELLGMVLADGLGLAAISIFSLTSSAVALAGLASFGRTDWYAWQRTKPPVRIGAPIGRLVAIGVLVGMLGGVAGPVHGGLDLSVNVAER